MVCFHLIKIPPRELIVKPLQFDGNSFLIDRIDRINGMNRMSNPPHPQGVSKRVSFPLMGED